MLKILSELGHEDQKALLIELPSHIADQVEIAQDGSVDTLSLLKILRRAAIADMQSKNAVQETEDEVIARKVELMNMIFNPEIAADFDNTER